jgi:hypothetical protein
MKISHRILRVRNIVDKVCTENQNTHFIFNIFFPHKKSCLYEVMLKDIVEVTDAIWRMRLACWVSKDKTTHSEYVIRLFSCNIYCTNAPRCYVLRTSLVLLVFFSEQTAYVATEHYLIRFIAERECV